MTIFKSNNKILKIGYNILPHILGIVCFLSFEITQLLIVKAKFRFTDVAYYFFWEILFFYFSAHATYRSISKKKFGILKALGLLILNVFLFVLIYLAIWMSIQQFINHKKDYFIPEITIELTIHRGLYIMALSAAYWLGINYQSQKKQAQDLKVAYLESLISPHLILNALNVAYSNVLDVSEKAGKTLLVLAKIMRFSFTKTALDGKVLLVDEVEHMKNDIELNYLSKGELPYLSIDINIEMAKPGLRIPANLLFNLVENLFKHAILKDPLLSAHLCLNCIGNHLKFQTKNVKRKTSLNEGWNFGLSNTRFRLDRLYPKSHKLEIIEDEIWFHLNLTIDL